jgi:hypothetical protein
MSCGKTAAAEEEFNADRQLQKATYFLCVFKYVLRNIFTITRFFFLLSSSTENFKKCRLKQR